ncbi:hypothetical protein ABL78_8400 [Leptomonas seymouri]|uniref:Uncharacterized protein n=1 Tax=Leptomonas seymouri TaxID=5684 RepID=A0A0N1PAV6_LEPSE|nr:hypothetical protein ABL78_8400 [Leptomonas seymouri]|eukprot:KPI82591.1 hypothetical protein ABL78_8400 [Leptomonas seymouri]
MSSMQRPYRIGGFNVCCYHSCPQAAAIHTELKKLHIDAAVVDHAFIISPLQLAVAVFRVESNYDIALLARKTMSEGQQQQQQHQQQLPISAGAAPATAASSTLPGRKMSFSRRIFAALSLTHNLDRILQILPPGPQTSSVVVLYRAPRAPSAAPLIALAPAEQAAGSSVLDSSAVELERSIESAIQQTVRSTNPTAVEHSFSSMCEPFWRSDAVQYAEESKLMGYYGVSESMMAAARHSLSRRDVQRVCSAAVDGSEVAQRRALRWHTLELCVTTQLAACTA